MALYISLYASKTKLIQHSDNKRISRVQTSESTLPLLLSLALWGHLLQIWERLSGGKWCFGRRPRGGDNSTLSVPVRRLFRYVMCQIAPKLPLPLPPCKQLVVDGP
jgi:hypothetical protein